MSASTPEQRLTEEITRRYEGVVGKPIFPPMLDIIIQAAQRYAREREMMLLQEWKLFFSDVTTPRTYIDFESWADDAIERRKSQSEQKAPDHE